MVAHGWMGVAGSFIQTRRWWISRQDGRNACR
jgi:hypothetical protein